MRDNYHSILQALIDRRRTFIPAFLDNQQNDIEIARRRHEDSVLLIKALGGGWDSSKLPLKP